MEGATSTIKARRFFSVDGAVSVVCFGYLDFGPFANNVTGSGFSVNPVTPFVTEGLATGTIIGWDGDETTSCRRRQRRYEHYY